MVTFKASVEQIESFKKVAQIEGVSLSELIRESVEERVENSRIVNPEIWEG